MKHKHKDIEGSRRLFEIEVSPDAVKKKYEEIFNQIEKVAQVPGYRVGKAPRSLLEKLHGQKIKDDTIENLVLHNYRLVLTESETSALGTPEVSEIDFDLEKGLFFKVKVDIRPSVKLKRYKSIAVKKKTVEVKSTDIDKYLSVLRESNAVFNDCNERTVKMGDYIVCDLECLVDGKSIFPKRKGVWIFIDKTNPIPSLIDGLIDARIDEVKEINTTLPKDFQEKKYADKLALFRAKLLKIKEKKLPDLDDDFAKRLGSYNNVEELRKAIESDLTRKLEDGIKKDMENQIFDALLKENSFSVPNELVERETKRLMELKKDNPSKEQLKEEAIGRVKLYFILDEIARLEGIQVTDEELDKVIESLAKEYSKTKDELNEHYRKNDLLEALRDQLKENKVVDFLISNAKINP